MRTDAFDFALPETLIALEPARPRDSARLLHVRPEGPFEDRIFRELPSLLRRGDVLVRNVTHVIPAALTGARPSRVEAAPAVTVQVNLIAPLDEAHWQAFARPGKRLKPGDRIEFGAGLTATVEDKVEGGLVTLAFNASGAALDALIAEAGAPPLPPYIADRRPVRAEDIEDYQTVYADPASEDKSVAAPTAGLHFTPTVFDALEARGIGVIDISLAVGAGTFLPVKSDDTADHVMHEEVYTIEAQAAEALKAARAKGGRVIAVGTTALRALESAPRDRGGQLLPVREATRLFITPGFQFGVVDGIITNFHLPRSTLFMLVCAFAGFERMQAAYAHAVAQGYRFYSYGDGSLLWRAP
jgi:S-adenosylmethionine:tRNA ribosyltransferase-isomerase